MHRNDLLETLARYDAGDVHERACRDRIEAFVRTHTRCFERSLAVGHVVGSVWLTNRANTHVLLTHHRKLGMWLQLGGHADGESDILGVALREAREESGIAEIEPVSTRIFDLDVHRIPPHGDEAAHYHYDIRFLARTVGHERYRASDESIELAWVSREEIPRIDTDRSVLRMHAKWIAPYVPMSVEDPARNSQRRS